VSDSYWPVPFCLDQWCGASDFKRSGHPRLNHTGSLKWTDLVHWIKIGRPWFKERGKGVPKLGFWWTFRWGRTGGQRRLCSGGSWSAMRSRRDAAGRESLDGEASILDCFLWRKRRAAGVRPCDGVVMGTDERVRCKGKEGLAILPGDAGGPGKLGSEVWRVEVVWGSGDYSPNFSTADRVSGSDSVRG
jgi:hypothetical protein